MPMQVTSPYANGVVNRASRMPKAAPTKKQIEAEAKKASALSSPLLTATDRALRLRTAESAATVLKLMGKSR